MLDWNKACVFRSLENTRELRACNKDCLRPMDQIHPGIHCQKSRDLLGRSIWLQVLAVIAMCWKVSNQLSLTSFSMYSSNKTLIQCVLCKEATNFQRTSQQTHVLAVWRTGKMKEVTVKTSPDLSGEKTKTTLFSLPFNWFKGGTN